MKPNGWELLYVLSLKGHNRNHAAESFSLIIIFYLNLKVYPSAVSIILRLDANKCTQFTCKTYILWGFRKLQKYVYKMEMSNVACFLFPPASAFSRPCVISFSVWCFLGSPWTLCFWEIDWTGKPFYSFWCLREKRSEVDHCRDWLYELWFSVQLWFEFRSW